MFAAMTTLTNNQDTHAYTIDSYEQSDDSGVLTVALGGGGASEPHHGPLVLTDLGIVKVDKGQQLSAMIIPAAEGAGSASEVYGLTKLRYFAICTGRMLHWYDNAAHWERFAKSARKKHRMRVDVVTPINDRPFVASCVTGAAWLLQANPPTEALAWRAALGFDSTEEEVDNRPVCGWVQRLCAERPSDVVALGPEDVAAAIKGKLGVCPPFFEIEGDESSVGGTEVKTLVLVTTGADTSEGQLVACVLAYTGGGLR